MILPAAHEEASIPASLNPNLVHVAGGAELAIYGNFYGQEDMWLLAGKFSVNCSIRPHKSPHGRTGCADM